MARFKKLLHKYDPWLVLSLRETPEGGGLLSGVKCDSVFPPASARELVVLVHGFNNHMGEAAESYQAFRDGQHVLSPTSAPSELEGVLGDCFWPGDADWTSLLDKTDFFFYPTAVHTAPKAGKLLARFLLGFPDLLHINFIGHSLGCRVILECIKHMEGGRPAVGRVVLMAAAVPVCMVANDGALAHAMETAASVLVLHSTADIVLNYAFPPGQTKAGKGEGVLPVALGRDGPPAGTRGRVEHHEIDGAGHSDYWTHDTVAKDIADFMYFGQVCRAVGTQRIPGAKTLAGVPREALVRRTIAARHI